MIFPSESPADCGRGAELQFSFYGILTRIGYTSHDEPYLRPFVGALVGTAGALAVFANCLAAADLELATLKEAPEALALARRREPESLRRKNSSFDSSTSTSSIFCSFGRRRRLTCAGTSPASTESSRPSIIKVASPLWPSSLSRPLQMQMAEYVCFHVLPMIVSPATATTLPPVPNGFAPLPMARRRFSSAHSLWLHAIPLFGQQYKLRRGDVLGVDRPVEAFDHERALDASRGGRIVRRLGRHVIHE